MPNLVYELPETYLSVTRPVAFEVIKQVCQHMGINPQETPIFIPGANGKLTQWNAERVESNDTAHFQAKEKIIAEIREEYLEDDLPVMISRKKEHPPFFQDKQHKIWAAPVYSRTKVTLSFRYTTKDRWQAESLKDYWRRKIADAREYMNFTARYKYPIPTDIEKAIYLLYRTRAKHQQDFATWQDYLFTLGSPHLVSITNAAGKGDVLALAEQQLGIQGYFTDPMSLDVEKDDIGGSWIVSFDFEYQYDKPISCSIHYPLVINNKMIPPQLYPEVVFDARILRTESGLVRAYYDYIQDMSGLSWYLKGPRIRIPEFDDWIPNYNTRDYRPLVSALILVDENNKRDVCNLKDLGEWGLNPRLHDSFKEARHLLPTIHKFPFHLVLYENDALLVNWLEIDEDLNITTKYDMEMDKVYHLGILISHSIKYLDLEGQKYFFNHPDLVNAWIDIILGPRSQLGYPEITNGKIRHEDFERFIKTHQIHHQDGLHYHLGSMFATVGVFSIRAHDDASQQL